MASEFAPAWSKPFMTKAQPTAYIKHLEKNREKARKKREEMENSCERDLEMKELKNLEKELDNL